MIGPLIAAGAQLASGLMGASSAKSAAKKQYQQQKEFAQNGIQWKVEDAKKAMLAYLRGELGEKYPFKKVIAPSVESLKTLSKK